MKNKKEMFAKLALFAFIILFAFVSVAYAKTKSDLYFCKQPGVIRTMKIIGLTIGVIKVALPILIAITAMVKFVNVIISGKEEDLMESAKTAIKKIVAGIIIFIIPGLCHYVFTNIVKDPDSSSFYTCESCLNNPRSCSITTSTPDIYTN